MTRGDREVRVMESVLALTSYLSRVPEVRAVREVDVTPMTATLLLGDPMPALNANTTRSEASSTSDRAPRMYSVLSGMVRGFPKEMAEEDTEPARQNPEEAVELAMP